MPYRDELAVPLYDGDEHQRVCLRVMLAKLGAGEVGDGRGGASKALWRQPYRALLRAVRCISGPNSQRSQVTTLVRQPTINI